MDETQLTITVVKARKSLLVDSIPADHVGDEEHENAAWAALTHLLGQLARHYGTSVSDMCRKLAEHGVQTPSWTRFGK